MTWRAPPKTGALPLGSETLLGFLGPPVTQLKGLVSTFLATSAGPFSLEPPTWGHLLEAKIWSVTDRKIQALE